VVRADRAAARREPGEGLGPDGGFEFGLQRVLDGIEQRIDERATR
jgi:hypothetical protein